MEKRFSFLLNLTQYLALVIAALISVVDLYQNNGLWWLAASLYLGLGLVYWYFPCSRPHVYLAVELGIVTLLLILHPMAMILGFTLSAEAMSFFPNRTGAGWVAALVLISLPVLSMHFGWQVGILSALGVGLGYASFGLMTYARKQADRDRQHSQALLSELQEAHRQLKEYTEKVETLAVAEERNRLAREMHDTLGHRLTVAAVQLEGAQRLMLSDPERAARMVGTVREQVSEALAELRKTVATLRTPLEVDLPLPVALGRLAEDFMAATGLLVHYDLSGDLANGLPQLPAEQRLALYRAAQEGLTNVQRHSQAGQVWLRLYLDGKLVVMEVEDDGVGMPEQPQAGFGLRGLNERATRLGGSLVCEPRQGGGTRLVFRMPLPEVTDYVR